MFNLILVVISIALIAAVTAVSLNYSPMDAQMRQLMQKEADRGIKAIECAVTRYLDANRGTDGNIIYPGNGVNLIPAVTPAYGFLPANVRKEMTWEITTGQVSGMNSVGICLRPISASTAIQRDVLNNLQGQLPVGSAYVSSGCNATSNVAGGGYLTYWVPLAHVN
ncbi:hypothetical protein [Burkholderia ubonensis]|uniref:hypothetical protein n=1 Tax=Burkholderia ubonensis TaxID=101571 RepID=UPI000753D19E|nr:hypothetical protein [Burkholderia ubonensis]KVP16992.1 hypothetical protein WJ84_01590 [Burkholderia ubonensis]KVP39881.1 hypothetical protein WJ87_06770 [Burkholderia ubonensis]